MIPESELAAIARDLVAVPGVVAVALGGSRARGTHAPDSDLDLGVYVHPRVDRVALSDAASARADGPVEIGPAGSWGPWVDSGAWLRVEGSPVDVIVRDVDRVDEQTSRALQGRFAFHAQPGHPLGFLDVAYAGEVALCRPLADPNGYLHDVAALLRPYPGALRTAMLDDLWQIDFALDAAAKAAARVDAAYVALAVTQTVMRLAHAWHAAAGAWVVNEKGLVPGVGRLPIAPADFGDRVAAILAGLGSDPAQLLDAVAAARSLPRPSV